MTEVLPASAPATAIVHLGDHFHAATLLGVMETRRVFHIMALSQKRSRLLKCTESGCEEVPFPSEIEVSLNEFIQMRKPDHVLDNRASGGPSTGSMKGVMFGTSTDRENRDEYMLHFFTQLDRGVNIVLKGSDTPLIPLGVEHEIALYGRINTYPHLIEPGVHGAADGLEMAEIHGRAVALLNQQLTQPGYEVPADFDKRVGTGHASTHFQDILIAAASGRVSHLFFQPKTSYTGTFDPVRQRVKQTADPLDFPQALMEVAVWQTILHGGVARVLPGSAMPNGVPVCALFRYPAPADAQTGPVETAA